MPGSGVAADSFIVGGKYVSFFDSRSVSRYEEVNLISQARSHTPVVLLNTEWDIAIIAIWKRLVYLT